jgi:hypothetical protein
MVSSLRCEQLGVGGGTQPLRDLHRTGRDQHRYPLLQGPYISFAAVVLQDVKGRNLEKPTRREKRSLTTLHLQGTSPALDIAGAWGFGGSGYDPGTLAHKTWSQIAGSLANPHNRVARRVDGLANLFTAAICTATNGRPGGVCKSRGVRAADAAVLGKYPSQPPPPPPS